MTFFSRLSDIVTCNLTELLRASDDPATALVEIIGEMEEGVAGARRSVATASENAQRLRGEIDTLESQVASLRETARQAVSNSREEDARRALLRKQEAEDVAAGLTQEFAAAVATRDHLETMLRALQARLADARRKQSELASGGELAEDEERTYTMTMPADVRSEAIEEELAQLKREMASSKEDTK